MTLMDSSHEDDALLLLANLTFALPFFCSAY